MSLPYFPMYPTDFEAKTSHLSIAEDGAYNRLLRICWMTPGCSMPADEAWVMRRARAVSEADQEAVRAILSEFFTIEKGRYSNARLTREWIAANEAHEKRKNAGAKGGAAKGAKTKEKAPSNAQAMPKQPEPEPDIKTEAKASAKKSRRNPLVELPEGWVPNDTNIADAQERGFSQQEIDDEADRFANYHSAKQTQFRDWNAAWRTWLGNARKFGKSGGLALAPAARGYEQGGSIASIVARRRAEGTV